MAVAQTSDQKTTALRIQRALAKPGAIGMKGFLMWAEAAFPPAMVKPILRAAAKYVPGGGPVQTLASPAAGGFGRLGHVSHLGHVKYIGSFGDDSLLSDVTISIPDVTDTATTALNASSDPTLAPVSGATAATPSQPASNSWLSDIGNAITAATTAYLGATQIKDAQSIFNTNLARAQQGLPPIPTNPTQYGLPAPTANIGLAPSAQSSVWWLGGGFLVVLALGTLSKRR